MTKNLRFEQFKERVKDAARGQWTRIVPVLTGTDSSRLNGSHGSCPKCGGTDRFRSLSSFQDDGAVYCNQCFNERNGDGFSTIQWLTGWTFPQTVRAVAEHLGIQENGTDSPVQNNGNASSSQAQSQPPAPSEPKRTTDDLSKQFVARFGDSTEVGRQKIALDFQTFADAKPPITVDAIVASGGRSVVWPLSNEHGQACIAFPCFLREGEPPAAYLLRRVDGKEFKPIGNLGSRKTHTLKGSTKAWLIPGGFERLRLAAHVIRVEGEADALAIFQYLPDDWAVVTNSCGANSVPENLEIFSDKIVYVLGDADSPGVEGAIKFAAAVKSVARQVRLGELPYPVEPEHGKDVRDYFNDGHTFEELRSMLEASPEFERPGRKQKKSAVDPASSESADTGLPSVGSEHFDRIPEVLATGIESHYRDTDILRALATEAIEDPPAYAAHRQILRDAGVRMREFDTAMRHIVYEARKAQASTLARDEDGGFYVENGCLCREKITVDGPVNVPICNFVAEIVDETIRDDGVEQQVVIGVEGSLAAGKKLPRVEVSAANFQNAERWVTSLWGTDPIVWPGESRCLIPAIQALSKKKTRRVEFSHLGWRKLNDQWTYLHAGGAISASGNSKSICVSLGPPLDKFKLPDPSSGEQLRTAVQRQLEIPSATIRNPGLEDGIVG